jgi:creatinine amidohydrolase
VCMASWYLASAESKALLEELRESEPGGMAHACELETSLYLALEPELVQMDRAVREIPLRTPNVHMDWADGPLSFMPHWSSLTRSGVTGDATLATAEKGRRWLARAQDEIAEYIAEVRERPHPTPVDHH